MIKILKQVLGSLYIIYTALLVIEVLTLKGYKLPIAEQWIILGQVIASFTCGGMLVGGWFFNICMLVDNAHDTKRMRASLYNMVQDNLMSTGWIVYPVLLTIVAFQYALWVYAIGFVCVVGWIFTARLLHLSLIREATITELK